LDLVKLYREKINAVPIERSLSLARDLGTILWQNELPVFDLAEIENFLFDQVTHEIKHVIEGTICPDSLLVIATELYSNGGHSRLFERIVAFSGANYTVDLMVNHFHSEEIYQNLRLQCRDIFKGCQSYSDVLNVAHIISRYNKVVTLIHPDDIYNVVCIRLAKKLNPRLLVYFVNHSDHTFTYGVSMADSWFELSKYGSLLDEMRGLTCPSHFLGIPIDKKSYAKKTDRFKDGDNIMMAASYIKFRPSGNMKVDELVVPVLNEFVHSKLTVIGVRPFLDFWWWKLKLKYGKRLKLMYATSHSDYTKLVRQSDLYLDSYPMPGGTAFAEQYMTNGQLCSGLTTKYIGYSPLEKYKRTNARAMLKMIMSLSFKNYYQIDNEMVHYHSPESVKSRYINVLYDHEENVCYIRDSE